MFRAVGYFHLCPFSQQSQAWFAVCVEPRKAKGLKRAASADLDVPYMAVTQYMAVAEALCK